MGFALNVTFVGLFVVFVALILLSLIITLSGKIVFSRSNPKRNETVESIKESSAVQDSRFEAEDPVIGQEDELNLIPVIAAAIAASLSTTESKILVKSIRRIPLNSPSWNTNGRFEQILYKL